MATSRPRPPDPAARRAKQTVKGAVSRAKNRLGKEYPQLDAGPRRPKTSGR